VAEIQKECAKLDPRCVDADRFATWVRDQSGQSLEDYKSEMRNNMKLHAFVYNAGAKEKQKEYQRVQKAKRDQIVKHRCPA
jgi:hypothetical protein